MLQQNAGSSGEPLRSPVTTGEPAFQISAKDRNEPVVQILPEVKPKANLLRDNSIDTHCRKLVLLTYLQELKQAKRELGAVSNQEMHAHSSREKPPPAA
jgi:hypothetical protein